MPRARGTNGKIFYLAFIIRINKISHKVKIEFTSTLDCPDFDERDFDCDKTSEKFNLNLSG